MNEEFGSCPPLFVDCLFIATALTVLHVFGSVGPAGPADRGEITRPRQLVAVPVPVPVPVRVRVRVCVCVCVCVSRLDFPSDLVPTFCFGLSLGPARSGEHRPPPWACLRFWALGPQFGALLSLDALPAPFLNSEFS